LEGGVQHSPLAVDQELAIDSGIEPLPDCLLAEHAQDQQTAQESQGQGGLGEARLRGVLKWAAVPGILILCPMILFGVPMLLEPAYLAYVSLVAGLSGALLGFLQVFSEAGGDKRSLLLHRPLTAC
jgi:hypothetical protein